MLFNSSQFLVFFPLVTAGYYLLPHPKRWAWLLLASCAFYMAFVPAYLLILAFTILIDYAAGLAIAGARGSRRRTFLIVSLAANIGVLAFFKYFDFLNDNLASVARALDWNYPVRHLGILLPIGLSFHTFQSMSYTIEVYRGAQRAERHLGVFALYVMFYPQLVAGPIERPQNLLHQLRERHRFDYERVVSGLQLMLWGFFKKIAVADRLARFVDAIYGDPTTYRGHPILLATVFFAFQIYCDFSGYSDIARGAARTMGVELMRNFDRPYAARSVPEFWRRWHISLSTWFKDYLYVPLGGSRLSKGRWVLNVLVVFLVSGLWHGANWTFVVWGGLNGAYLVLSRLTERPRAFLRARTGLERAPLLLAALRTGWTFGLICLSWVFFRARTVSEAWFFLGRIAASAEPLLRVARGATFQKAGLMIGCSIPDFKIAFLLVAVLEAGSWLHARGTLLARLRREPAWVRWAACYALIALILAYGNFSPRQFIYFQF